MSEGAGKERGLEARLERLESIVEALEREDLELDVALELFEEGVGHLRAAREVLSQTELRIEHLLDEVSDAEEAAAPGRDDG